MQDKFPYTDYINNVQYGNHPEVLTRNHYIINQL